MWKESSGRGRRQSVLLEKNFMLFRNVRGVTLLNEPDNKKKEKAID